MSKKKPKPHEHWEVLPAVEMRREYGLYAENRPLIKLDPKRVPEALRKLIPLAEKFRISDDLIREDFFAKAPKRELGKLKRILSLHDDLLDEWLAGPEAEGPEFSDELGRVALIADQGGPANGSQPIRSETNRTSSAGGSRR